MNSLKPDEVSFLKGVAYLLSILFTIVMSTLIVLVVLSVFL